MTHHSHLASALLKQRLNKIFTKGVVECKDFLYTSLTNLKKRKKMSDKKVEWQLIQSTPVEGGDLVDTYDTPERAVAEMNSRYADEFDEVIKMGGYYYVQDENGNEA